MSNLHCPNCDHLIGSLKPAMPATAKGARDAGTWAVAVGWDGWKTSGEIYSLYRAWAAGRGAEVPTQRTFSTALLECGAQWKRSNRGRLYSRS